MSVRKSERGISSIEFLKVLLDIEKWVLYKTESCPKKYRFIVNNQLLTHAAESYSMAKMGNSVRVYTYDQKVLREKYFTKSYIHIQAFVSQIDAIYSICKSSFMTNNELEQISKLGLEAMKLLTGVMKTDRQRYKDITS